MGPSPDAPGPPARGAAIRRLAGRTPVLVAAVAVVVGTAVRWWLHRGASPLVWNDTSEYLRAAGLPLSDVDRWAGPRGVLMPLVLSAASSDLRRFVTEQTLIAGLAWGSLAMAVASALRGRWRPWVGGGLVLAVSLTWPVAMWDEQVLTESLALSTLALAAAAALWAARGLTPLRAGALVATVTSWLVVRDSHVVPVVLAALGLAGWAVVRGGDRRRLALLTAGAAVSIAALVSLSAAHGDRERLPLEHVYAVRVLPYADRVAWFVEHGMPEDPALLDTPLVRGPGRASYTPLTVGPVGATWRAWVGDHGRATLVRYVLSHPGYVVSEPLHHPERVFNNRKGLDDYRPLARREVPGLAAVAYPPVPVTVTVAAAAAVLAWWRRVLGHATFVTGAVLVATSLPHALVVWHSDGMESARHLLVPGMQLRVGTLLLVVAGVMARRQGERPRPARRRSGTPPSGHDEPPTVARPGERRPATAPATGQERASPHTPQPAPRRRDDRPAPVARRRDGVEG